MVCTKFALGKYDRNFHNNWQCIYSNNECKLLIIQSQKIIGMTYIIQTKKLFSWKKVIMDLLGYVLKIYLLMCYKTEFHLIMALHLFVSIKIVDTM